MEVTQPSTPANRISEEVSMNSVQDAAGRNSTQPVEVENIHFIRSWLQHTKLVLCNKCKTNYHIVLHETNCFGNISMVKCNGCDDRPIYEINPWWMFGEYEEAKQDIFRFL